MPNPDHVLDDEQIVIPTEGVLELRPNRILDSRERVLRNRILREHLVEWKDYPEEDATWESEPILLKNYLEFMSR